VPHAPVRRSAAPDDAARPPSLLGPLVVPRGITPPTAGRCRPPANNKYLKSTWHWLQEAALCVWDSACARQRSPVGPVCSARLVLQTPGLWVSLAAPRRPPQAMWPPVGTLPCLGSPERAGFEWTWNQAGITTYIERRRALKTRARLGVQSTQPTPVPAGDAPCHGTCHQARPRGPPQNHDWPCQDRARAAPAPGCASLAVPGAAPARGPRLGTRRQTQPPTGLRAGFRTGPGLHWLFSTRG
jgi:hypothetical protein